MYVPEERRRTCSARRVEESRYAEACTTRVERGFSLSHISIVCNRHSQRLLHFFSFCLLLNISLLSFFSHLFFSSFLTFSLSRLSCQAPPLMSCTFIPLHTFIFPGHRNNIQFKPSFYHQHRTSAFSLILPLRLILQTSPSSS
jgi:hypothetical protein